jgi:tetratricopeptide (TPR) repeat protein
MGDFGRSLADLDKGIRLALTNPDGYYNRGIARYHVGDVEGALADWYKTLKLKPHDRAAQRWIERARAGKPA